MYEESEQLVYTLLTILKNHSGFVFLHIFESLVCSSLTKVFSYSIPWLYLDLPLYYINVQTLKNNILKSLTFRND